MRKITRRSFFVSAGASALISKFGRAQETSAKGINKTPNVKPGAWPVMYTPFKESGEVDYAAVKEMAEFYVSAKVSGIFAAALSGEVFSLSFDEALEIGREVTRQVDGRIGVVVGANFGSALEEQASNLARMQEAGVDAAVIVLSKLPSGDDVEGQLISLMERTNGPLGIYECPAPKHRQISVETARRLAQTGHFHFIKETSRDPNICAAKAQATKGTPFRVFSATLPIALKVLELGADGHCGTVVNFCPELARDMCETGDPAERKRIHDSLTAINEPVVLDGYPSSGKYVLQKRGLHMTTVSRSLQTGAFTDGDRMNLDELLKHFDFTRGLTSA
jgi:4-hydroxy-tetrahydrodipicolinate synthase